MRTAPRPPRSPARDRRARVRREGRNVVYCSEHAHSSIEKARRLLRVGAEVDVGRRVPDEAGALDLGDAVAIVATAGTTSTRSSTRSGDRERSRSASLVARRRRVRRLRTSRGAPLGGRRRARRLDRRQSAQVALHADRLLRAVHPQAGRAARRLRLVPEYLESARRPRSTTWTTASSSAAASAR